MDAARPQQAAAHLASAPIVAVAIDVNDGAPELSDALLRTVQRVVETTPNARIACLNVLKLNRIALDHTLDEEGRNKHVQRLVALKAWARPLGAAEGAVTFHVIEAVSPAEAILEFARENQVDHIVMGARAASTMRSLLGSVSGEVAAHAPCTVTVVRRPYVARPDGAGPAEDLRA